jgi:hypothetical protein
MRMTFEEIVAAYIRDYRADARAEMRFFEIQRRLDLAIRYAALCLLPSRKRHPHQRRIPQAVLNEAERRLQADAEGLNQAPEFEALHRRVKCKIGPIQGIGDLTVYDIAHRLGVHLGKLPTLVYLHSGTKTGAAALGIRGEAIDPKVLPPAFARLTPAEIEDCLCVYKNQLRSATGA